MLALRRVTNFSRRRIITMSTIVQQQRYQSGGPFERVSHRFPCDSLFVLRSPLPSPSSPPTPETNPQKEKAEEKRWVNEHDAKLAATRDAEILHSKKGSFTPATPESRGSFSPASPDSESGRALQNILERHSVPNSAKGTPLFQALLDLFTLGAGGARR